MPAARTGSAQLERRHPDLEIGDQLDHLGDELGHHDEDDLGHGLQFGLGRGRRPGRRRRRGGLVSRGRGLAGRGRLVLGRLLATAVQRAVQPVADVLLVL